MVLIKKRSVLLFFSFILFGFSKSYSSNVLPLGENKGPKSSLCRSLFSNSAFFSNVESSQILSSDGLTISGEELNSKLNSLARLQIQIDQLLFNDNVSKSASLNLKTLQIKKLTADFWNSFNKLLQFLLPQNLTKEDLISLIKKEVAVINNNQKHLPLIKNKELEKQRNLINSFVPTGQNDLNFVFKQKFRTNRSPLAIQSNGKILLAEVNDFVNGYEKEYRLMRLNVDHSVDRSFKPNVAFDPTGEIVHLQILNNDKILIIENYLSDSQKVHRFIRLNEDGSTDETFNLNNKIQGPFNSFKIQDDGKILVCDSNFSKGNIIRLLRLTADGLIDETFDSTNIFQHWIDAIQTQDDGGILVGGGFVWITVKEKVRRGLFWPIEVDVDVKKNHKWLVRLKPDGKIDSDFNMREGFDSRVTSIQVQNDGTIIVGGLFTLFDNKENSKLVGLKPNGQIEENFYIGSDGFNRGVTSIQIQKNGYVLVGGAFDELNGENQFFLVRLTPDGQIDKTFDIGTGFNGAVKSLQLENNTVIVRGDFDMFNGIKLDQKGLVRIGL